MYIPGIWIIGGSGIVMGISRFITCAGKLNLKLCVHANHILHRYNIFEYVGSIYYIGCMYMHI